MSTPEQRGERTRAGSEWMAPGRARVLRAKLRQAAAMLKTAGETITAQERIIARQEQTIAELRTERLSWYSPVVEA